MNMLGLGESLPLEEEEEEEKAVRRTGDFLCKFFTPYFPTINNNSIQIVKVKVGTEINRKRK